ncbi:NmrA domain-containing protein [Mycena sanguinolenta]|uniref:NmrA domain-containing protein n=1 Tax=Mycena sanguinolenta TaxID=230812 RepID=A0A8H6Z697_9AGAR|nr:NmrA domain-containing protein [Mycena sanguinolenta]
MSPPARIITVFGATGQQGSSVLNAVLADETFTPRAISRNADSERVRALRAKGVEVVKADLFDVESLKEAIKGSEAVFGVTNFWDPAVFPATPNGIGEVEQGKNLVDAAKAVGVKLFIWSNVASSTVNSNGKHDKVYHIDHKATVWEYLKASGVPCVALDMGFFPDNFWVLGILTKPPSPAGATGPDYILPVSNFRPEATQTFTWTRDIGPAAVALLKNYTSISNSVLGKVFPVVTGIMTYPEVAAKISAALGKEVVFTPIETTGLAELDRMYAYQSDCGMYKDTPVPNPELVALGAKLSTMDQMIEAEIVPRFS